MTSKEKIKQYKETYAKKKPMMNTYVSKKYYWKKKGYTEEYIKSLYDIYGDNVFEILKAKEEETKIREEIDKTQATLYALHNKLNAINAVPVAI